MKSDDDDNRRDWVCLWDENREVEEEQQQRISEGWVGNNGGEETRRRRGRRQRRRRNNKMFMNDDNNHWSLTIHLGVSGARWNYFLKYARTQALLYLFVVHSGQPVRCCVFVVVVVVVAAVLFREICDLGPPPLLAAPQHRASEIQWNLTIAPSGVVVVFAGGESDSERAIVHSMDFLNTNITDEIIAFCSTVAMKWWRWR